MNVRPVLRLRAWLGLALLLAASNGPACTAGRRWSPASTPAA